MTARRPFAERRRQVSARWSAILLDSVLVAYALWAVDFLVHGPQAPDAWLVRWPGLVLAAPFVGLWASSLRRTLGEKAQGLRRVTPAGEPAPAAARAQVAFGHAVMVAAVLAPLVLGSGPWAWGVAGLILAAWVVLGLCDPEGASLAERWAGVRGTTRRLPPTDAVVPWHRRLDPWLVLGLIVLTCWVGARIVDVDLGALSTGWGNARALWGELASPEWSVTPDVVERLVETVFLAFMASLFALPLAFGLGFLGARNVMAGTGWGRMVYRLVRMLMNVTRSIEPILWAITFTLWVGIGPFAGMLALLVHSTAALGKLYSEAVEGIDPGPVEALRATGAAPLHVVRYGMVPQVVPPFLSFTIYRWDINVRMATILGLVGGGGIGELLLDYQSLSAWNKVGTIIVFVTLVVWVMDVISSRARERLL